jgi:hypothetical protein
MSASMQQQQKSSSSSLRIIKQRVIQKQALNVLNDKEDVSEWDLFSSFH